MRRPASVYQRCIVSYWLLTVSRNVALYFLYCAGHFPLLTFYGQFVKTISYLIILIFCSTLFDKGVIVRPTCIVQHRVTNLCNLLHSPTHCNLLSGIHTSLMFVLYSFNSI